MAAERKSRKAKVRRPHRRAEEELQLSEGRYRRLFETAKDGILILDAPTGQILDVNPFLLQLLGYALEDVAGKQLWEISPFKDVVANQDAFKELRSKKHIRYEDLPLETKDGRRVAVEFVSNTYSENGNQVIQCNVRDISKRTRAERALRESEERFRSLYESSRDALMTLEPPSWRFTAGNPAAVKMFGAKDEEDFISHGPAELSPQWQPDGRASAEKAKEMIETAVRARAHFFEWTHRRISGEEFSADVLLTRMEQKGKVFLQATVRDITARKRAEEQLVVQTTALASAANAIVITDRDGQIIWVNPAFTQLTGYTSEEAIGCTPRLLKSGMHDRAFYAQLWGTIRAGQVWSGEMTNRRKDGSLYTEEQMITPVHQNGVISNFVAIKQDITERVRAEHYTRTLLEIATQTGGAFSLDALLDATLPRIAETLPCDIVAALLVDPARNTLRITNHHGIPPDLLAPALALEFRTDDPLGGRRATGQPLVINDFQRAQWLPAELRQLPLSAVVALSLRVHGRHFGRLCAVRGQGNQPPFTTEEIALFTGITQQVALGIETVQLYEAQQEEATVSSALARLGEVLSTSLHTPLLLERLCQFASEILDGNVSVTFFRQAKEPVWTGVARYGDTPGDIWELFRTVPIPEAPIAATLERLDRERVLQFDDAELAGLLPAPVAALVRQAGLTALVGIALRCDDKLVGVQAVGWRGSPKRLSAPHERIARGISQVASVALENKRLIDGLEHINQLKSDFMSTMSHELRTPLNVIMGYNDLLLDEDFGPLNADQMDTLRRTQKSAGELLALINATLDIGRLDAGKLPVDIQEIDLDELHREIVAEATNLGGTPTVTVLWDVPADLPRLDTDRAKLKAVVKNLLANAVKFTDHGQVTIHARAGDGGVEIVVADTGIGIAPDVLPIIFEPFRQGDSSITRRHSGVGLGLYIVRRYLDLLGGTIGVESAVGRGSTFRVWLPSKRAPEKIP